MTKRKKIPDFASEAEERAFWEEHDSTDYVDWNRAKPIEFTQLKPSTKTISLRLPEILLNDIKTLANKQDVPYQSLMKILLANAVSHERRK